MAPRNRYLDTLTYGNNDSVEYTYDSQGRVILETYEDGDTVSYDYDNTGALATVTDSESGIKTSYYYDLTDRLAMYTEKGSGYNHTVQYKYDEKNRLTQLSEVAGGMTAAEFYYYDEDDRVTDIVQGSIEESYDYDAFGRQNSKVTKNGTSTVLTENLTYKTVSGSPTGQVSSLSSVASGYNGSLSYTYDDNGNILTVSDGTYTTSYVYDTANQLVRENNQAAGKTWTWTYDGAGNIQNRKEYAYTTGTLGAVQQQANYLYENSNWGDLLTSYNGTAISSDAIGNMLSDGTWNYTWQHGRELASMTDGSTTWNFSYNADGMRTGRSDGSTTYKYFYIGGRLSHMLIGSSYVHFAYDTDGAPIWMRYNGSRYFYVTNLQGDVIAILDSTGTPVVQYTYDAWGKVLSITGSMADTIGTINPLLYRGYIYDHDTGLYYLQSRYYSPTVGRFICADVLLDTATILGVNLFAYCGSNPIMFADPLGYARTYVFYYNRKGEDFYDQAMNSPYYNKNSKDVYMMPVISVQDFINAWNSMSGTIENVYLYLHGGKGVLHFFNEDLSFSGKQSFGDLKSKKVIKRVYLFSCKGGAGSEGKNVAWMFAKLTGARVQACTGKVSFTKVFGKYYARKALDFGIFKTFYYQKRFIFWGSLVARSVPGLR